MDFGLTIRVTEGSNNGPPIVGALVSGELQPVRTDATGNAVVDIIFISVAADGFEPYVHQPYSRPALQTPVTVSLQRAVPSPSPSPLILPSREEVLANLRADLVMLDVEGGSYPGTGVWEALSWDDARFATFAARYIAAGNRLLPCNLRVDGYLGATFDYTTDLPMARARLERCYRAGLIPMVCLEIAGEGKGAEALTTWTRILPELRQHIVAVFTGWEIKVDGSPTVWTFAEHARIINLCDRTIPGVVIGVEFWTPEGRTDPIFYDGRGADGPVEYWQRPEAQRIDVVMLELPYSIINVPRQVATIMGGGVCRLQGLFPLPTHWPDGETIATSVLDNWRTDYGLHKYVMLFEYASYLKWSSAKKRALREFVHQLIPISGYGEG